MAKGLTGQGLVTLKEQSDTAQLRSHQFLLIPEREVEDEVREGEVGEKREREILFLREENVYTCTCTICVQMYVRVHVTLFIIIFNRNYLIFMLCVVLILLYILMHHLTLFSGEVLNLMRVSHYNNTHVHCIHVLSSICMYK